MTKEQKERKQKIIDSINNNENAVYKALIILYKRQTANEQAAEDTEERNNVGFSGVDANFLTSLSKQYLNKRKLSTEQIRCARKRLVHYTRQLMEEI